ncbi:uncharacterized protein LOC115228320 [Octopus sinensis]|uniref:Uncharacterized protein LOC115228320 n=1 Tax=Octopus sinensis TaxID=2607531 RepID=A0A6P7TXZ8_9MOLL|nr:uncharacterized protein LOC115228320 [Octopus sinensis]
MGRLQSRLKPVQTESRQTPFTEKGGAPTGGQPPMSEGFLALTILNARSLARRASELRLLLATAKSHILIINETKLKEATRVEFEGYKSINIPWKIYSVAGTGTSVYYRANLKVRNIRIVEESLCELIVLELHTTAGWLTVGGMYSKSLRRYSNVIGTFFEENCLSILAGDLNAKNVSYGCETTNMNGTVLEDLASSLGFSVFTSEELNHYADRVRADRLGLFLCSASISPLCYIPRLEADIGSDHVPQTMLIKMTMNVTEDLFIGYNLVNMNWSLFESYMRDSLRNVVSQPLRSRDDIDNLDDHLRSSIIKFLDVYALKNVWKPKGTQKRMNSKLVTLIRTKVPWKIAGDVGLSQSNAA